MSGGLLSRGRTIQHIEHVVDGQWQTLENNPPLEKRTLIIANFLDACLDKGTRTVEAVRAASIAWRQNHVK